MNTPNNPKPGECWKVQGRSDLHARIVECENGKVWWRWRGLARGFWESVETFTEGLRPFERCTDPAHQAEGTPP